MYKDISISIIKSVGTALAILILLSIFFGLDFEVSTPSLTMGIIGTILLFVGGALSSDALGRYDSVGLPHYSCGSLLQSIGLGFTAFALIVK